MNIEKIQGYHCPVEAAMDVIGGKYKALIVYELISGTRRYNEIQRAVPQATPRMLSNADRISRHFVQPPIREAQGGHLVELFVAKALQPPALSGGQLSDDAVVSFAVAVRDNQHKLAVELALLNLLEDAGAFPGVGADSGVLSGGNTAGNVRKSRVCVEIYKAGLMNSVAHFLVDLPHDAIIPVRNKSHSVVQPGPAFDGDGVHSGFAAEAAAVGGQGAAYAVGVVDPASFVVFSDFGKSRWTCLVESKYFSGTAVSKIPDNVHPIAGLGDAEIFAVKHLPCDIVPQFIQ